MLQKMRSNAGITLIELLVASVIALICTGAALELYISQQKNWLTQENITDMQQNGRSAMDEIVYHARQAGYQLPPGLEAILASNSDPDTVTFVYLRDPICKCALVSTMSGTSDELRLPTDSIGCYDANMWAYIYNPATEDGEYFLISGVEPASGVLQHASTPFSQIYPAGSEVYLIDMATFYVDNVTDSLHPRLMYQRFGQPNIYADNIEDLQLTYRLAHGVVVDSLTTSSNVREVNIGLVARTDRVDPARGDDYLRDTFFTSVYLRNMDF